ncbi:MAG: hypothetical protein ACI8Z1_001782 [Candidatus Azotimanducaceae bacterium]|jgi:hypothetical protein
MKATDVFWDRILTLTETDDEASMEQIRAGLLGIDEGFSGLIDPADSYPEYVTMLLCRYMYRVTEKERCADLAKNELSGSSSTSLQSKKES